MVCYIHCHSTLFPPFHSSSPMRISSLVSTANVSFPLLPILKMMRGLTLLLHFIFLFHNYFSLMQIFFYSLLFNVNGFMMMVTLYFCDYMVVLGSALALKQEFKKNRNKLWLKKNRSIK